MTQSSVPILLFFLHLAVGQLASFDELRQAYIGSLESQEPRDDRSLTNTYPFNQVANQASHHQSHGSQHASAQTQSVSHQGLPHQSSSQYRGDISSHTLPASATGLSLQPQSQNLGFSLLSGFGSRTSPSNQYQVGVPSSPAYQTVPYQAQSTPVYQPTQGVSAYQSGIVQPPAPTYQTRVPQPAFSSPSQFLQITTASSACPFREGLPLSQCVGTVNSCWSVGQADVDCPNQGLCCFDGCANICLAAPVARAPSPVPAPVSRPVPAPVRIPARRIPARNPLQGRQPLGGTSFSAVAAAGKKCIDKIETVEEIEYDEVEECNHSYDKQCHTTYVTEYESQQEEECDDNYKKSCQITYSPSATNVTVQICRRPLVKDCNLPGPEICRTEYISECWTRNDPHLVEDDVPKCKTVHEEKCEQVQSGYTTEEKCSKWPREVCTISRERKSKFNPVTKCEKVPQELCGPSSCGFVEGSEICHEEVKTVVTDIPEEVCDLQPRRTCGHVTKLVPKLTPTEECVDVPKEVCTKGKANPRTVQKPVTKQWCYTPSRESGLA